MIYTQKIQKAIDRAAVLHNGQFRKCEALPYVAHPYSVAFILANYTDDENIIIAGLLHDIFEDVDGYTKSDMKKDFGAKIVKIVTELSEDKKPSSTREEDRKTWQSRKENFLKKIKKLSFEAKMVACADKIHNISSAIESYKKEGKKVFSRFNAPLEKKMWFYREAFLTLRDNLKSDIVDEFGKVLKEFEKLID